MLDIVMQRFVEKGRQQIVNLDPTFFVNLDPTFYSAKPKQQFSIATKMTILSMILRKDGMLIIRLVR